MSYERRGGRRIAARLVVFFKSLGSNKAALKEMSRDISAGGLFIETGEVLPLGEQVEIEIFIDEPDAAPLKIQAEVTRQEEGRGIGVRFLDVTPTTLFQLAYLLRKLEHSAR